MVVVVVALIGLALAFLIYHGLQRLPQRLDAAGATSTSFTKLDEALLQFVMLYKRLPCPASGTAHTGLEDPQPSSTDYSLGSTTCNSPSGVVPWKVLGLSQTQVLDPWNRYIAYRVYDGATGFTRSNGLSVSDCINESTLTGYSTGGCAATHENTLGDFFAGKGLSVNDYGTSRTGIAYALISMGESGNGAYYPAGTAPNSMPSSSSKEFLNAGSAGTYWTLAASGPDVAANDGAHFDDALAYKSAFDLGSASRAARPWSLQITLDGSSVCSPPAGTCSAVSPLAGLYLQNPLKMSTNAGTAKGAVTVTATADSARLVCTDTSGGIDAMAACVLPGDELTTSGNERLTFDFKVRRTVAMVKLKGMQSSGGGDERAVITFYNGATQVAQFTKTACHSGGNAIGQYSFSMPAGTEFTLIDVRATTKTGGGGTTSSISVAAVAACYPLGTVCQVPSYSSSDDCP